MTTTKMIDPYELPPASDVQPKAVTNEELSYIDGFVEGYKQAQKDMLASLKEKDKDVVEG